MVMTRAEAFRILEVDSDASGEEIRSHYKRLALKWHPDKHNNSQESTMKFQEISEAYKRLTSNSDDDNIKISMADMFDLFAHIFFNNGRYFTATHGDLHIHVPYVDDEDRYHGFRGDSSVDERPPYRARGRKKYCDLVGSSRSTTSDKNNKKNKANTVTEAEAMKNAEELIKEEERNKKKAEKRRAKKKRSREKRKQREKEKRSADDYSENDESDDEDEKDTSDKETTKENKNHSKEQNPTNKKTTRKKNTAEKSEEDSYSEHEEASWDTSSAFFANAARRGPVNNPCTANETTDSSGNVSNTTNIQTNNNTQATRGDSQGQDDEELEPIVIKSRQLAVQGNNLANEGKYKEAIGYFTKAINLHNSDFRFFGNRSYCYDRLGEFTKALQDAEVTITLAPVWPKGYFRKGRALAGLKQYSDAETAFSQVLKLDKHCDDAKFELTRVRVQQLKDMGFAPAQSERAVRLYGTVHAALDALLSGKVKNVGTNEEETYISGDELDEEEQRDPRYRNEDLCSLWVGNIDSKTVTERQLTQIFSKFGPIDFIRILPSSFCAFVNYENRDAAAKALQSLQGFSIGGQIIKLRYPNVDKNPKSFETDAKLSGPVNGDECYFWRTTGCAFGTNCRYAHIPAHRRIDLDKVEQKFGKIKPTKKGR